MAAHRYWRVLLPPQNIGNGTMLSELALRATVGGASINGSATRTGNCPANWFDGNTATETYAVTGSNAGLSPWAAFDFGAAQTVAEVYLRSGSNNALAPQFMQLQYSDDGVTWRWMAPTVAVAGIAANTDLVASGFSEVATPPARAVGGPFRPATSIPGGPPGGRVVQSFVRNDLADGGAYRVAGTVAIDGTPATPVRRRVRLFQRLTGRLVRETWSDAAGNFSFEKIALAEYLVVSDDYTRLYNAVVADAVVSVP